MSELYVLGLLHGERREHGAAERVDVFLFGCESDVAGAGHPHHLFGREPKAWFAGAGRRRWRDQSFSVEPSLPANSNFVAGNVLQWIVIYGLGCRLPHHVDGLLGHRSRQGWWRRHLSERELRRLLRTIQVISEDEELIVARGKITFDLP